VCGVLWAPGGGVGGVCFCIFGALKGKCIFIHYCCLPDGFA